MQQLNSQSASQSVVCASRSRLGPVVSLWVAPEGAQRSGRCRQRQSHDRCGHRPRPELQRHLRLSVVATVSSTAAQRTGGHAFNASSQRQASSLSARCQVLRAATGRRDASHGLCWSMSQSSVFMRCCRLPSVRPNTSLNLRANGMPQSPVRGAEHFPQPGLCVIPSSPG